MTPRYPYMQRATHNIEVGRPRNGRPGYVWVQGWIVVMSPNRQTMAMRYREAQRVLREMKGVAK